MRAAEIVKISKEHKTGTFVRIKYRTAPPLTANAIATEHDIQKITEKTVRLGVNYMNISKVKEAKENGRGTREMYEAPIIENLLYENKKNGKLYLRVATVEKDNSKVTWLHNGKETDLEDVKGYVRPSYFNKKTMEVQNISVENIISLGKEQT